MDYHTFLHESKRLFLEEKLKEIRIKKYKIAQKYHIKNIEEFDDLFKQGKADEFKSFDDFKEYDRLEYLNNKIENYLNELMDG